LPWQERNILMEFLQTMILKALSISPWAENISFMGGTSLRFVHSIDRFSEDLDFDLVKKRGFDASKLSAFLNRQLALQGFDAETAVKTTPNIKIINVRFPKVLQEFGLSAMGSEKFLVKMEIDPNPAKKVRTETVFIDSFNERFPLLVNTPETLFAQKIIALSHRSYLKGRDIYDILWFLGQKDLQPNYALLRERGMKIANRTQLTAFLLKFAQKADLKKASIDVRRFLFYPQQQKWILKFPEYIESFKRSAKQSPK
jgi:predicted nucleotidyltransferase component of viral defense system